MIETGRSFRAHLFAALCCATIIAGLVGAAVAVATPALAAAPLRLIYRVTHSVYGDIGTYRNTIEPTENGTTIHTWADFQVTILGLPVYHEEARGTEHWRGNRLVSFHGVTDKNGGEPIVVNGEARGDSFVITSPEGRVRAPASVRLANPWSAKFLGANTMMRPDTGKLERVQITGGQPTTVSVDGETIPVREYDVKGQTAYRVWLDRRGVPVKFVADDDTGTVTFTLTNCGQCELALSYLANIR